MIKNGQVCLKLMPVICQGSDRPRTGHGTGLGISNILKLFLEMTLDGKIFYFMNLNEKNWTGMYEIMYEIDAGDMPRLRPAPDRARGRLQHQ
jgi:hypothetical protein